ILSDSADKDRILTGGILGHREVVSFRIVHQRDTRCRGQGFTHGSGADRAFALECQGHTMSAQYRDPYASGCDADVGVPEYLSSLLDDLGLFLVVAGRRIDPRIVTEQIERIRVWKDGVAIVAPFQVSTGRLTQLFHGGRPRSRGSLVG